MMQRPFLGNVMNPMFPQRAQKKYATLLQRFCNVISRRDVAQPIYNVAAMSFPQPKGDVAIIPQKRRQCNVVLG